MSKKNKSKMDDGNEHKQNAEIARKAAFDLVGAANSRGADRLAVDIRVEEAGPVIVVEDDGSGMTPEQLDDFIGSTEEERLFYGADEVHIATTHDGRTLKAHSYNPPEYDVTSMEAARREEGTRVEVVNFTGPDDLTKHLDEEELREDLHLDKSDWTALLNVHVGDYSHTIRRLDEAPDQYRAESESCGETYGNRGKATKHAEEEN